WDCRWPDPVAMQVAHDRIRLTLDPDRPDLNMRLPTTVRMEPAPASESDPLPRALLVTPWAAERVFWGLPDGSAPPISSAFPLQGDDEGRVDTGQGVVLHADGTDIPVIIGWEPETGHFFSETLLKPILNYTRADEVLQIALGERPTPTKSKSLSNHLEHQVSRRSLFGFLRRE
ncbi:MAG: hypothetical protein HQL50_11100, partial [Magnetococcales bacterium]|nr:hypothetical protein [Magnetococcales bacterium]